MRSFGSNRFCLKLSAVLEINVTELVSIQRFNSGWLLVLLLTSKFTLALAEEPGNSTLIYGDGKEYQTIIQDAQLLGELPVQGGEPFLVFSGRSDRRCDFLGCDAETTVFFQRASDPPNQWNGRTAKYPGNYYVKETGKLVAHVRMFIGRCLDSREGVAWFIENFEGRERQDRTLLKAGVVFEFIGDEPPGSLLYGLLRTEFPAHQRVAVARKAVSRNVCQEIPPRLRISRPAADYVGMDMPDSNLMFDGAAPPKTINKWMKYQIMMPINHPWPITFFSTQEFALKGAGNESLIVLTDLEYNKLQELTGAQLCTTTPPPHYRGGARITAYHKGHIRICWLSQNDTCQYLTGIANSPDIHWTADQSKSIKGLAWDTECKDSGWWEYQEKFRHDAESWAKAHRNEPNPTVLPDAKQSSPQDH
jgi:hypothetical protein